MFRCLALLATLAPLALWGAAAPSAVSAAIRVDQVGYLSDAEKLAMVVGDGGTGAFSVVRIDAGEQPVLHGTLARAIDDPDSGDRVRVADFSGIDREGTYVLDVDGVGRSWPFAIGRRVYQRAYYLAARSFYG